MNRFVEIILHPDLRLHNLFVRVLGGLAAVVFSGLKRVANFVEEIALHDIGDGPPVPPIDNIHHQLGEGVNAGGAVEVVGPGNKVLAC